MGISKGDHKEENLPPLRKPTVFLHPLFIFSAIWLGVVFLYSLHLSKLLIYPTATVQRDVLFIWAPFMTIGLGCTVLRKPLLSVCSRRRTMAPVNIVKLE